METKKETAKKEKSVVKEKLQKKVTSEAKDKKKENKRFIDKFIPRETTEVILTVSFLVLLIIVIILGIKAIGLKKEADAKKDVDIVIPVLEKTTNNTFSVDLSEMTEDEIMEYKFMITNYKGNVIAEEDIEYEIELTNNSDAVSVKLYKGKNDENLLTSTSNTYNIKSNVLSKEKKNSDTYYLIIRVKDEVEADDNISIKITGIN